MELTVIDKQEITAYLVQASQLDGNFLFYIREIDSSIDINFIDENKIF
ncbi:hypothetical protein [Bacillus sp. S10(2024)]